MNITGARALPEKVLREFEQATRMPTIRPETVRDNIMYRAGMRNAFTILCAKLNVSPTTLEGSIDEAEA